MKATDAYMTACKENIIKYNNHIRHIERLIESSSNKGGYEIDTTVKDNRSLAKFIERWFRFKGYTVEVLRVTDCKQVVVISWFIEESLESLDDHKEGAPVPSDES